MMTQETESPEPQNFTAYQPKSFMAFLAEQQGGAVVSEVSKELRSLVEAIEDHYEHFRGKVTGSLTLSFKVTLEGGTYKVDSSYATTRPKAPPAGTVMWLDREGNLGTMNPRQLAMPFTTARNTVREV